MLNINLLKEEFAKFIASQTKESMEEWIAFDKKRTEAAEKKEQFDYLQQIVAKRLFDATNKNSGSEDLYIINSSKNSLLTA